MGHWITESCQPMLTFNVYSLVLFTLVILAADRMTSDLSTPASKHQLGV